MSLVSLLVSLALAQEPPVVARDSDLILVISGGVSRGAYQAGQMYVFTSWLRELQAAGRPEDCGEDDPSPRCDWPGRGITVAGASAGSMNAVLTSLELAAPSGPPWGLPERSLPFRAWIPLGFGPRDEAVDRLPEDSAVDPKEYQALIHDQKVLHGLEAAAREVGAREITQGQPPVRLVMTVARHQPTTEDQVTQELTLTFGFELDVPSQPAVLASRCPGERSPPCKLEERYATVRLDPRTADASPLRVPLAQAAGLSLASSTIPAALPLFELSCLRFDQMSSRPDQRCSAPGGEEVVWLMDGGTLENNPLRVAYPFAWRGDGTHGGHHPPFLFLDPDLRPGTARAADRVENMWQRYFQILGGEGSSGSVIDAARSQSISLYLDDYNLSTMLHDASVPAATSPYGGYMGNFLALYDRSLRVWDFYAGMEDAFRWIQHSTGEDLRARVPQGSLYGAVMGLATGPEGVRGVEGSSDPCKDRGASLKPCWSTLDEIVRLSPLGEAPAEDDSLLRADATQTWRNLLVLSQVYRSSEEAREKGRPWSLSQLADALEGCVTIPVDEALPMEGSLRQPRRCGSERRAVARAEARGEEGGTPVRYVPLDLRLARVDYRQSFGDGLQWYSGWQLGQVGKRDVLSGAPLTDVSLALLRQFSGSPPWSWTVGLAGPELEASGFALAAGVRGNLRWDDVRMHPVLEGTLRLDWPLHAPQLRDHGGVIAPDSVILPADALSLQVGAGFNVGFWRRGGAEPPVFSPRYNLRLGFGLAARTVLSSGVSEADLDARTPIHVWVERDDFPATRLGAALGGTTSLDLCGLTQFEVSWFPYSAEQRAALRQELSEAPPLFSRDWMVALRFPL